MCKAVFLLKNRAYAFRRTSVTSWLDYLLNVWPLATMKICPTASQIAKVGSEFNQILNIPLRNGQRFLIFTQNLFKLRSRDWALKRLYK